MTALAHRPVGRTPRPPVGASGTVVGVLIPLPEPLASRLAPWRDRFVAPPVDGIPPHITLLPPTLVQTSHLRAVADHVRDALAPAGPFEVHLRGSGSFLPVSPVTFVQVAAGIAACEVLQARVRSGPLARPLPHPYHPHVTVAHNVDRAALDRVDEDLAGFDARFEVAAVELFTAPVPPTGHPSAVGSWSVLERFELVGPPGAVPGAVPDAVPGAVPDAVPGAVRGARSAAVSVGARVGAGPAPAAPPA